MPIYEFVCATCENEFEKILSFSATQTPACPACGGQDVNRQMSKPAIHFKGSGWYITDSKSKESANGTKSSSNGADTESAKGDAVKSESAGSEKSESTSSSDKPSTSASTETSKSTKTAA